MKNDTEDIDGEKTSDNEGKTSGFKPLTINYELYEHYLEDCDLTEAQKREFLDMLWAVIVSFVDLGFGVHPVSQVTSEGCGQNIELYDFLTSEFDNVVESKNQTQKTTSTMCHQTRPAERLEP